MAKHILIIEDNRELSDLLGMHLRDLSYETDSAAEGNAGLSKAESYPYDLIILDLILPGLNGLEICKRLRAKPSSVPILMLTSKSSEMDRVLGLEIGADDYMSKPFSIMELLARVKAIFRRIETLEQNKQKATHDTIHAGDLSIDPDKRLVTANGKRVDLTTKEFDLLHQFARHPGRVYTRSQLLDIVWGYRYEGYEHTVNSHINRLRAKIEDDHTQPRYILTVWGVGYKFSDSEEIKKES